MRPSRSNSFIPRASAPLGAHAIRLLFVLSIVLGARALHAEPTRIVLITSHADASIIPLLRAELSSLGVEVLEVPKSEQEVLPDDLSVAARSLHAVAAFRVLVSSR